MAGQSGKSPEKIAGQVSKKVEKLLKAAEAGDTNAQNDLGDIYYDGAEGVEKDLPRVTPRHLTFVRGDA